VSKLIVMCQDMIFWLFVDIILHHHHLRHIIILIIILDSFVMFVQLTSMICSPRSSTWCLSAQLSITHTQVRSTLLKKRWPRLPQTIYHHHQTTRSTHSQNYTMKCFLELQTVSEWWWTDSETRCDTVDGRDMM